MATAVPVHRRRGPWENDNIQGSSPRAQFFHGLEKKDAMAGESSRQFMDHQVVGGAHQPNVKALNSSFENVLNNETLDFIGLGLDISDRMSNQIERIR